MICIKLQNYNKKYLPLNIKNNQKVNPNKFTYINFNDIEDEMIMGKKILEASVKKDLPFKKEPFREKRSNK